ncbi:MAG: hypothetical protein IKI58_05450 [Oscillospiraceae bacterium]|nr:hypothetical protein [Oscillospiraceae bacterium]
MRNENAYLTNHMAEKRVQQSWNAFCESGSVPDYLQYRSCCAALEGKENADTSDRQGACHP